MPRPLKPRVNYALDIASLHRIAACVRVDERVSAEARERVVSDLHKAIKGLMGFELASLDAEAEAEAESDAEEAQASAVTSSVDAPPVTIEILSESDGDKTI